MNIKHIATRRSDLYFLSHSKILIDPGWNSRTTFTGIPELAEDIAGNGLITPLRIRNLEGTIYLIDGERRHRAIAHGISTGIIPADFPIPVIIEKSENLSDRLFSQLAANTGVPFTLIEKARLYSRLRTEGIAIIDMAKRSQTSKQSIYQALTIIDKASPHLITLIDSGKISATFALDIISQHEDHHTQDQVADAALEAAHQSGQTKATAKNAPKPPPEPPLPAENTTTTPRRKYRGRTARGRRARRRRRTSYKHRQPSHTQGHRQPTPEPRSLRVTQERPHHQSRWLIR